MFITSKFNGKCFPLPPLIKVNIGQYKLRENLNATCGPLIMINQSIVINVWQIAIANQLESIIFFKVFWHLSSLYELQEQSLHDYDTTSSKTWYTSPFIDATKDALN
jgi:hypothetical protein